MLLFLVYLACVAEHALAFRVASGLRWLPEFQSTTLRPLRSSSVLDQPASDVTTNTAQAPLAATVTVVIPSSDASSYFAVKPFGDVVTWREAFEHIKEKLRWEPINNPTDMATLANLAMNVVTLDEALVAGRSAPSGVVLLVDLDADTASDALAAYCKTAAAVATFGCRGTVCAAAERYGDYQPAAPMMDLLASWDALTKSRRFRDRGMRDIAQELWARKSTGGHAAYQPLYASNASHFLKINRGFDVFNSRAGRLLHGPVNQNGQKRHVVREYEFRPGILHVHQMHKRDRRVPPK